MATIGPHSRPSKLAVIDGRSAEARRMKEIRAELFEHLGGQASKTQAMLIGRIAVLTLRIELMDRAALKGGAVPDNDAKQYLAWNNALSRMLRQLGLKGTPAKAPSLAEHIASKAAA